MYLTLGLFIGTVVVLGLIASTFIPAVWLLGTAVVLASMQVYTMSVAGVYFSASYLASIGAWRFFGRDPVVRQKWYMAVVALVVLQLMASLWSPNPVLAIRTAIYILPFLFMVPGFVMLHRQRPAAFRTIILLSLGIISLEATLVLLFRASPSVEARFLSSFFGRFFVSPNALGELANGAYTIFDPAKSGGFFVNANVASVFLGFTGLLAWFWAPSLDAKWLRWVAGFNFLVIPLTGSKAGVIIGVVALALYGAIQVSRSRKISLIWIIFLCFGAAIAIPAGIVFVQYFSKSEFLQSSNMTLDSRVAIWDFAWQTLQKHPLEGLGFGGWELQWPQYAAIHGYNPLFPPHNAFVALFVQTGFLGPVVAAFFVVSTLWFLWKTSRTPDETVHQAATGTFLAILWLFSQAQGENYGVIGEAHITPLMALALAYIYILSNQKGHAEKYIGSASRRFPSAAVQTI